MTRPTDERILEFCRWQSGQPNGMSMADWRAAADTAGFADIGVNDLHRAAAVLRALAACDAQHASVLEAALAARVGQASTAVLAPQPIETAPMDGRWILAYDPTLSEFVSSRPWTLATRCDGGSGFRDCEGNYVEVQGWIDLPDPQPKPTGWTPPSGNICVREITGEGWTSNGKPVEVSWRWIIEVEKPDGSRDTYRDSDMANTRQQAEARAAKWQAELGLPIVVLPLPAPPSNVVPLRKGDTLQ